MLKGLILATFPLRVANPYTTAQQYDGEEKQWELLSLSEMLSIMQGVPYPSLLRTHRVSSSLSDEEHTLHPAGLLNQSKKIFNHLP